MKKTEFIDALEKAKTGFAYKNYLEVREAVWKMVANCPPEARPSEYWQEEIAGFDYMFDASPLITEKLRHHSYHLTGLRENEYRSHHARNVKRLLGRFHSLRSLDKNNLLVGESPILGGFGFEIGGVLCNVDTLKFYESLIALDKSELLDKFRNGSKKIVLEIGAGWGGMAYQWKTLFPSTCYVLVDFPETILFSATYLKTLFPNAKFFFADGNKEFLKSLNFFDYDFIFVPNFAWEYLSGGVPDLLINQTSFQEMTTGQVENYIKSAKEWGVPNVYSWNRDRSPNNPELSTVSEILKKFYTVEEISLLPPKSQSGGMRRFIDLFKGNRSARPVREYRHLLGKLN